MRRDNLVLGQKVDPIKAQRARELRQRMTEEEKLLWQVLKANRLDGLHFRRQQVIDGFIADFYCHAAGLVVEVDGPIHEHRIDYDDARTKILAAHNLDVLRITNDEVRGNLPNVLNRIADAARARLMT